MAVLKKVIIGNWKMNQTIADAKKFISELIPLLAQCTYQIGLAVPFTALATAAESAKNTPLMVGAQNISNHEQGAYTGEISGAMIKEAGASFVLIGHSERRRLFHEMDKVVNEKIRKSLEWNITPVFCIGETLDAHQEGKTKDVLTRQIMEGLKGLTSDQVQSMIIAYEPVWAIGSNQAATPVVVQEAHVFCRSMLAEGWGKETANKVVIQYGGSVTPANTASFLEQPDVNGLLVGGASLSFETFSKIVLTRI